MHADSGYRKKKRIKAKRVATTIETKVDDTNIERKAACDLKIDNKKRKQNPFGWRCAFAGMKSENWFGEKKKKAQSKWKTNEVICETKSNVAHEIVRMDLVFRWENPVHCCHQFRWLFSHRIFLISRNSRSRFNMCASDSARADQSKIHVKFYELMNHQHE